MKCIDKLILDALLYVSRSKTPRISRPINLGRDDKLNVLGHSYFLSSGLGAASVLGAAVAAGEGGGGVA